MPEEQFVETTVTSTKEGEKPDVLSLWRGVQAALNIILSQMIYNTWILPTSAENLSLIHISEPTRPY